MLQKITVRSPQEYFEFRTALDLSSDFRILKVEGLNPVKADINTTPSAALDGVVFNSARVNSRNIVITIKYDSRRARSIDFLRTQLYKVFPVKSKIEMKFETSTKTGTIDGYVESHEVEMFSSNSVAVISIICPDHRFKNGLPRTTTMSYNEYKLIDNDGDLPTGVVILGRATNIYSNAIFSLSGASKVMVHTFAQPLLPIPELSDLKISTNPGERYARLYTPDQSKYENWFNTIAKDANWLMLQPGWNYVKYTCSPPTAFPSFSVSYQPYLSGV